MKLTILGASGHGKVVADIAKLNGYDEIEILDDDESLSCCGQYSVIGKCEEAKEVPNDIFFAIGSVKYRKRFLELFSTKHIPILVHPDAVIAEGVEIGIGTVVTAGVVINPGTIIGKGCIVNTCASIDHDCEIGDYVHVAVGAHLCGTVLVGDDTWIGAGSTVSNNVNICGGCTVGAGAVVIKDIEEKDTYIGVPAIKMSKIKLIGGYCYLRKSITSLPPTMAVYDSCLQRRRAA